MPQPSLNAAVEMTTSRDSSIGGIKNQEALFSVCGMIRKAFFHNDQFRPIGSLSTYVDRLSEPYLNRRRYILDSFPLKLI